MISSLCSFSRITVIFVTRSKNIEQRVGSRSIRRSHNIYNIYSYLCKEIERESESENYFFQNEVQELFVFAL
jgi:hypothetical protein